MTAEEKYPLLIGHAIDGNKRLHNIQQVASFICKHGQYGDVTITFEDGRPFLDTFGIYINKIADMDYREELLKTLIPMQVQLETAVFESDADEPKYDDELGESDMNEWERLRKQAEVYKQSYPPGTRIMLLSMGNDPYPVADNTRGTVRVVDDLGTLHCAFDNGRSLGVVPSEDSFRKLTDEELAEEQSVAMDEVESGPIMGM